MRWGQNLEQGCVAITRVLVKNVKLKCVLFEAFSFCQGDPNIVGPSRNLGAKNTRQVMLDGRDGIRCKTFRNLSNLQFFGTPVTAATAAVVAVAATPTTAATAGTYGR